MSAAGSAIETGLPINALAVPMSEIEAVLLCGQRHEQNPNTRSGLFAGANLCCRGKKRGCCSRTLAAKQSFEANPTRKKGKLAASEHSIFRKETTKRWEAYGNWLLPERVSSRGRRTSDDRADVASDAVVT